MNIYNGILMLAIVIVAGVLFFALHRHLRRQRRSLIQSNIEQLALLRIVIAGLQRHRGLSNLVLSGDNSMSEDLANARQLLDEKLNGVQHLDITYIHAWENLIDHWSRLRQGRNKDQSYNLIQHNLLIHHCIFLMEDVANEIDLTEGRAELGYLPCIWRDVIHAAEWAGQARALGTSIASAGSSSVDQRVRMHFLYQKIEYLSGKAFTTLQNHVVSYPEVNVFRLQQSEQVIAGFLDCMKHDLLSEATPYIDAKTYFQKASESIEELLTLVDVALSQLKENQEKCGRRLRHVIA